MADKPISVRRGAATLAAMSIALSLSMATAQADCGCGEYEDPLPGRMTGGGSMFMPDGTRATHGFELRCDRFDPRQSLEVNWDNGVNFHMTELVSVDCLDDPDIDPGQPETDMDTLAAYVVGRCDDVEGATAYFTFQDAGEPGVLDYVEMRIYGCPSGDFLAYGLIDRGNHQAHP